MTRLSETASVYVTLAAALQYRDAQHIDGVEEARRELTEYLLDAKKKTDGTWRFRRNSARVDISARVVYESGLAVVTTVTVRSYQSRRGGHQ